MASSILLSLVSAGALATAGTESGGQSAVAPPEASVPAPQKNPAGLQSDLPILVVAHSSELDSRKNRLLFHSVTITQGTLRVDAGEAAATGLNFDNSQWQLWGDVHIKMEKGSLSSDRADVTFAKNQIARAVINGAPANFEQTLDRPPQTARGRANVIEYDVANGTVRLSKNAWLSDGANEVSGDVLVYDVRSERVVANSPAGSDGRVRITINPASKKPEAVPPSPKQ
jgi:lipopolysaccharide transport protein LptA